MRMLSRDRIQGKQNKSIKKKTKNFVGLCRSGTHKRLEELFVLFLCSSSRAGITLGVLFFTASTTTTAVVSFLSSLASLYVAAIRRQKVVGMRTWGWGFLEDFLFTLAWLRSLTTNIGVSESQSFCNCSWNYALLVVTLMSWWRLLTWESLHDMSVFFSLLDSFSPKEKLKILTPEY